MIRPSRSASIPAFALYGEAGALPADVVKAARDAFKKHDQNWRGQI